MRGRAVACLAVAASALAVGHAQTTVDRTHRAPIVIDDQLFDPGSVTLAGGQIRPLGVTVDSDAFGWGSFPFPGWDFGVLPIGFGPDVTPAQQTMLFDACKAWEAGGAPITCVPRTSQEGYVDVEIDNPDPQVASGCYAYVGQSRHLVPVTLHLSTGCWYAPTVDHELGHMLGFFHEHQRPDRDQYITVDYSNVADNAKPDFDKYTVSDPLEQYDFMSIMHYGYNAFAKDPSKPTMIPQPGYASYATTMGTSSKPTDLDLQALAHLYAAEMRPLQNTAPTESVHTQFDRNDFLDAMERLNALYMSKMGLMRTGGLSIGGRPDFVGIATWIFDVYLGARSRGYSSSQAFGIVTAAVTQSDEWQVKHPGQAALPTPAFRSYISFDRNEFLDVLNKLDAYYASADGLQRPDGLSISGGPDFLGIAAWLFDVYLNERLSGASPNVAWTRVVNAIEQTDEWKTKHGQQL